MQWKQPKNSDKYFWTAHVTEKMHFYGLSEQKVLGVIRKPQRIETSIVENVVAVMVPVGNITKGDAKPKWGRPVFGNKNNEENADEKKKQESWNQEIWVMYQTKSQNAKHLALQNEKEPIIKNIENLDSIEIKTNVKKVNTVKKPKSLSAKIYPEISSVTPHSWF